MMWIWAELRTFRDWAVRNPLTTAFSLSIVVHLTVFGGWKIGDKLGWWKHQATWLLNITKKKKIAPNPLLTKLLQPKPIPPVQREIPLTFVEVDPATAAKEAPKNAKHYAAFNSVAANPDPAQQNAPKIDGQQNKVTKVENVPKPGPQPLQPALPPEPPKEEQQARPKEDPGDLPKKPSDAVAEVGTGQAKRERPRTLAQAREQKGLIVGQKSRQDGGAPRRGRIALDAVGSPFGAYDAAIIAAIQQRWYDLLDNSQFTQRSGKVVLEFRLHYDGRITDMVMPENDVGELLALLCQRAIMDPSPFPKWPDDMRRMVGKNYREVLFTFYYE